MKTTLDLPDELMREIKILAAQEGRKMKDIIAESLSRDLRIGAVELPVSVRDLSPVSVGRVLDSETAEDRMEDMLDEFNKRSEDLKNLMEILQEEVVACNHLVKATAEGDQFVMRTQVRTISRMDRHQSTVLIWRSWGLSCLLNSLSSWRIYH